MQINGKENVIIYFVFQYTTRSTIIVFFCIVSL